VQDESSVELSAENIKDLLRALEPSLYRSGVTLQARSGLGAGTTILPETATGALFVPDFNSKNFVKFLRIVLANRRVV
jgi:hypothetical protein